MDAPTLNSIVTSKWLEEHRGQLVCRMFISLMAVTPYSIRQMTSILHGLRVESSNAPISHSMTGTEAKYSATSVPPPMNTQY